eukprot:COSAG01_NODE_171_length_23132_cov_53.865118_22_plen_267_part_00
MHCEASASMTFRSSVSKSVLNSAARWKHGWNSNRRRICARYDTIHARHRIIPRAPHKYTAQPRPTTLCGSPTPPPQMRPCPPRHSDHHNRYRTHRAQGLACMAVLRRPACPKWSERGVFVSWAGHFLSVGGAVYSPRGPADERCDSACAFHHSAGQHSGLRRSACSQSSTADSHARLACSLNGVKKALGGGAACMGRDLCARVFLGGRLSSTLQREPSCDLGKAMLLGEGDAVDLHAPFRPLGSSHPPCTGRVRGRQIFPRSTGSA